MATGSGLAFLDDFEALPAKGISAHAHIISVRTFDSERHCGGVELHDAIATTLYKISPATLKNFLSPTVKSFQVIFQDVPNLVIWRKGNEVLIGHYEERKDDKVFVWDNMARLLISYDGSWVLKYTSKDMLSKPNWVDVWRGKFHEDEDHKRVKHITIKEMKEIAVNLASSLMANQYWGLNRKIKMT